MQYLIDPIWNPIHEGKEVLMLSFDGDKLRWNCEAPAMKFVINVRSVISPMCEGEDRQVDIIADFISPNGKIKDRHLMTVWTTNWQRVIRVIDELHQKRVKHAGMVKLVAENDNFDEALDKAMKMFGGAGVRAVVK